MAGIRFNPDSKELVTCNAIVSGRNTRYQVSPMEGSLSLKTVLSGQGRWETPDGSYIVTPESCLILNHGQTYGLEIAAPEPVHTFCVFFKPGFVEDVAGGRFGFYERLQLTAPAFKSRVEQLRAFLDEGNLDSLEAEEAMLELANVLVTGESAPKEEARLDLAKASTREGVFRDLNRSRDFALSNLSGRHSLEGLSAVACMSPFHYHRLHRQAFGESPHEFITRARLLRAVRLLRSGDDVANVSMALGFESVPTFTRLFKSRIGMTPGAFRKIG